jgi:hypothetical protein
VARPLADAPAATFARYRVVTGDGSFDVQLRRRLAAAIEAELAQPLDALALALGRDDARTGPTPAVAAGERNDQIRWCYWGEDGALHPDRGLSPAALVLAYWLEDEEWLAARALAKTAARLRLARMNLADGRRHGCSANTVSAVVRGHGRAAGIGSVTGALYPAAMGSYLFANADRPAVRFASAGHPGLPAGVSALLAPDARSLALHNGSPDACTVEVQRGPRYHSGDWLPPGTPLARVELPPSALAHTHLPGWQRA